MPSKKLISFIYKLKEQYQNITTDIVLAASTDLSQFLSKDYADLALSFSNPNLNSEQYSNLQIDMFRSGLAVSQKFETADFSEPKSVNNIPLIILSRRENPEIEIFLAYMKNNYNAVPEEIIEVSSLTELFLKCSLGIGIGLISEIYKSFVPDNVNIIYPEFFPALPVIATWKKTNNNPALAKLIQILDNKKGSLLP
ncbi:MAG: LysR substrate-binding domain-containing protein [Lachnospiraceae bacterium]